MERKSYWTTDKAGWHVAGRRIPEAIIDGVSRPKVGHELKLIPDAARYYLLNGVLTETAPDGTPPAAPKRSKSV